MLGGNSSNFVRICKNGTYYFPASSHYGENYNGGVQCDRCFKANLKASIGYKDSDLCIECVSKVLQLIETVNPHYKPGVPEPVVPKDPAGWQDVTLMIQSQFTPLDQGKLTYMMQDIYDMPKTKMMQKKYRTNMKQDIYNANFLTRMRQNSFDKKGKKDE